MSIRVSQRKVSEIEYENTYYKVYAYITDRVKRLPRRHMHYIGEPMNRKLNEIYRKIMKCTDLYLHGKGKSIERYRLCGEIARDFEEVISISYMWWNIANDKNNEIKFVKANQRKFWAELINKELHLIEGVAHLYKKKDIDIPIMRIYTKAEIKDVVFLCKLEQLQRTIYKRAICQGKEYRDAQMEMLMQLSRDAFYYALEGNSIFADDEKLYKRRQKCFEKALDNLYAMSRPVRELAFNQIFPEQELSDICNLTTECIKILKAIRAADAARFAATA